MSSKLFVIGFLLFAAGERVYARRFSRQAVRGQIRMTWTLVTLDLVHTLIYVSTAVEFILASRENVWLVTIAGLVGYVVSVVLRHQAIRALGRYWSLHLEIREGHQLIREGIYRHLRHPAYSAIMLEVVAIPLVANAYYTLLLSLGVYIPVLLVRWKGEEREMVNKFGQQYVQYQQEAPAFFPRLGRVGGGRSRE